MHKKELDCNVELYKKYGLSKKVTNLIASKDFAFLNNNELPWLDNDTELTDIIKSKEGYRNFSNPIKTAIENWSSKGYMILNSFYSNEEVDSINKEIEKLQVQNKTKTRLDERIIFAVRQSQILYDLATKNELTSLLSFILGKKVKLFQSLNFIKGSQQRAHSDTIHMTTFPLGYLIAVWVALEDITMESGPLFYYEGTHKLPYVLNNNFDHGGNNFLLGKESYVKYENAIEAIIKKNNLQKKTFLAKKGDIFIWHGNILHGGEKINNPLSTRKSMVLHYFTEDVICYHEITQRPAIYSGKEAHCPQP